MAEFLELYSLFLYIHGIFKANTKQFSLIIL
jgi:hypothetical protein